MKPYENPFRTEKLNSLPYIFDSGENLNSLYTEFKSMNYIAAITGSQGSGKSRLTELLSELILQDSLKVTYTRLSANNKVLDPSFQEKLNNGFSKDEIIVIDGCEQLNIFKWLQLKRRIMKTAKGLLITTHKRGRLPTLKKCKTSPELLIKLTAMFTDNRIKWDKKLLRKLYKKYNGNIRHALLELYDLSSVMDN